MNKPVCRSCGADASKQLVKADYVFGGSQEHKFWKCSECDLVYLWPIPSIEEEKRFYAQEFEKFMSTRAVQDRDWSGAEAHIRSNQDNVKRRWDFLKDEIKEGKEVLEIGCSSGFMLEAFKKAGMKVFGIEPSEKFHAFLAERGYKIYEDLSEIGESSPKQKFDLIVHFFVFEHIRNTKEFIEKQLNSLKPGGKIVAEVPCVCDPLTSLYRIPAFEKFYWSIAHHYYFSPKSLSFILDQLNCQYKFVPEQRYDLSNHLVWLQEGKPGGQGRYSSIFSKETLENYASDLKNKWMCDTFFVYIWKK